MSAPCAGSISGAQLPAAFRQLRFGGSCTPRRQRTLHRTAALPGSNGPPGRPGGGLILPGSDDFPAAGLPGGARRPGGGPAGFGPSGQATPRDGPLYQPFRPPPAYKDTASQSKDEMLNKLTTRAGRWFDLAKILDTLHATGVQNTDVFEITGIPQVTQNLWKVQASVYFSLAADSTFPPDLLSFFHSEDAAATLAELRTVPASWRSAAAVFVAQRGLGVDGARELARAIVDVDRGRPPGDGFDPTPGDALAAKIWRDAGEVRRRGEWEKEVAAVVERGLGVATSEKAKAKLRERLAEFSQSAPSDVARGGSTSGPEAVVQVVRLETVESAFRPVALLGTLDDITPAAVRAAPAVALEGVFNTFKPAGGTTWVALPAWAKLAELTGLFAVSVPDTKRLAGVPQLHASPGPALLVFDRNAVSPSPKSYYLVARPSSLLVDAAGKNSLQRMELLPGGEVAGIKGATVCGQMLVACRPPLPSNETHEARFEDDDDMAANYKGSKPKFAGATVMEVDFADGDD